MTKEYKVNRYYQNMCPEGENIRIGHGIMNGKSHGDRIYMNGQWQYPRALYDHLMTCPKCEARNTNANHPAEVVLTLSPLEVQLMIEALEFRIKGTAESIRFMGESRQRTALFKKLKAAPIPCEKEEIE